MASSNLSKTVVFATVADAVPRVKFCDSDSEGMGRARRELDRVLEKPTRPPGFGDGPLGYLSPANATVHTGSQAVINGEEKMNDPIGKIATFRKLVQSVTRVIPFAIGLLLFLFVWIGVKLLGKQNLSPDTYILIWLLLFTLCFSYFDWLIRESPKEALMDRHPLGQAASLQECLDTAMTGKTKIDAVRIYAHSTGHIHPLMHSFLYKEEATVSDMSILLYGNTASNEHHHHVAHKLNDWAFLHRDKKIGKLQIFYYNFYPTDYFVILNDSDIVLGRYIADIHEPVRVKFVGAYYFSNSTAIGASIIKDFVNSFDRLIEAGSHCGVKLVYPVSNHAN